MMGEGFHSVAHELRQYMYLNRSRKRARRKYAPVLGTHDEVV
jgi:hypothetical protein